MNTIELNNCFLYEKNIIKAIKKAVELAIEFESEVSFIFNDRKVTVNPSSSIFEVTKEYLKKN
jgi:hypothetical protein